MPSLEEIMGTSYRADMTAEEVKSFFKSEILGTGEYVSKAKADAADRANKQKIADLQAKVQGNLTDEELKAQEREALEARIRELEESQKLSKIEAANLKAQGSLSEARVLMGIADDDKDFKKFIDNISVEDSVKTESIGKYINKLIKDAYEKGQSNATKNSLGKMGNQNVGGKDSGDKGKDIALVEAMNASRPKVKEFKKSNFI